MELTKTIYKVIKSGSFNKTYNSVNEIGFLKKRPYRICDACFASGSIPPVCDL